MDTLNSTYAQHQERRPPPSVAAAGATDSSLRGELAKLSTPRLHRFLIGVGWDWGIIVATFVLARWINHWAAYAAAVFVIGTRQHAIGVLGHDGAHRLASRSRPLNNWITQLFCFWPVCSDMNAYRHFHFPHHSFLNTPRDPEMRYRRSGAPEWDVPRSGPGIAFRFVKDLIGLGAGEVVRVLYAIRPRRRSEWLGPILVPVVGIAVAAATGTLWVIALWFIALLTSFAAIWRLRCWIEHLGTDDTHRLWVPRWLAVAVAPHNVYMHWEHHKWPAVPFWNLPRARRLDSSVPVLSIWELFRYYRRCQPVKSGTPTLDESGRSLLRAP